MKSKKRKIIDILPQRDYLDEYECIRLGNKTYMDIIKIAGKDLNTLDEEQIKLDCLSFLKLYRTYSADLKIMCLNFPVDTSFQKRNIELIQNRTENNIFADALEEEWEELDSVQKNLPEKEYYMCIYSKKVEELNDLRTKIRAILERNGLYLTIKKEKKIQIMKKINNPNTRIDLNASSQKEPVSDGTIEKLGYNPNFIEEIQPCGNMNFTDDRAIKTGDGYMACIYIHKLEENLRMYWLTKLTNINNVITIIDINTETDYTEVKKNLNKAVSEQISRRSLAKDASEIQDADFRIQELQEIYEELNRMGEIIKNIRIRLFVSAPTYVQLEERISEIMNDLDASGYKCAVNLNEGEYEWKSIWNPYSEQSMFPNVREGIPVFSETLAGGHPFHFSSLLDPHGVFYGRTDSTGGAVLWDMFTRSNTRNYYNAVIAGTMRSGKSTLLKKIFKARACKGDFIRGFDVSGEWINIVKAYGGKIISLDGTDGVLNPWQVLKTAENESACFKQHISKLCTIYKFLKPTALDSELFLFEDLATKLYIKMGLIDEAANYESTKITGLPVDKYPISSKFVEMLQEILDTDYTTLDPVQQRVKIEELKLINEIKIVFTNLINTYGRMFNGYSTIEDIFDEQIVFFDIRKLVHFKSSIFDAQMYSALSICYDNCVKIGLQMKRLWERKEIEWQDITRFLILCDEAHRFVNANKITAVDQLVTYQREARKFFGGIIFASQSIHDFVPEGSEQEAVQKIRTLFELCQYKIMMRQDANAVDSIKSIFRGELTMQEAEDIPGFETGQCILCMGNKTNIRFHIYLSEEDNVLFEGGA